jgi:hypothetical protein
MYVLKIANASRMKPRSFSAFGLPPSTKNT